MTTPRIEENEKNKPLRHITLGGETYIYLSDHKEALTLAHQAGKDEAMEVVKGMKKLFNKSTFVAEIRDKWGDEFDDVIEEMTERSQSEHDYYNQALDDTLKALQDNK